MTKLMEMGSEEIFALHSAHIGVLTTREIEHIFKACDAFWHHPGKKNISAPHAKLTTGKHSDIYINCPLVLSRSNLCQIMAYQMYKKVLEIDPNFRPDWVTGSDSSALGLAKDMANLFGARFHPMQKVKYQDEKGEEKEKQVWEKMVIGPEEIVLHIEELTTTRTTAMRVRDGIRAAHDYPINFAPFLPILVFRPSGKNIPTEIDDSKILPVLYYETFVVDPEEEDCPLCTQGSEDLSPKGENWKRLVSSM